MQRRVQHTCLGVFLGVLLGATAHGAGGDIDPTFGVGGFVEHAIPIPSFVGDVGYPWFRPAFARDGGGRIVMAQSTIGGGAIEVRRFLPDGSADAAFGAGGVAIAPIWGCFDSGTAVLVDSTGGFIVRGCSTLVRFDSAGALVETFGNGGVVSAPVSHRADSLILPDGGVVDARLTCSQIPHPLTLDRYLPDGSLDPAFGVGGHTAPLAAGDCWAAIGRQSDGSLVVAANKAGDASWLVRFFADGTRDLAFGAASGETPLEFVPNDLVVMADDRIVVASGWNGSDYDSSPLRIARFTAAGTPDTTFGIDGVSRSVLLFQTDDRYRPRSRLLVADDGAATVFGVPSIYAGHYPGTVPYLIRFTPAGDVDTSFAPCGFAMPAGIVINDAALLPDGQVLLMGGLDSTYEVYDDARLRFARLGTPAPTSCLPAVPGAPRVRSKGFEKSFKASWRINGDVAPSAFGDPLSTSGFALCMLPATGASGDTYEARVFPGGTLCENPSKPCWKSLSRGGYRFKTRLGVWPPGSSTRLELTLKPGLAGKARLVVRESGIADRTTPVTLRLDRVDGPECWEATVEQVY